MLLLLSTLLLVSPAWAQSPDVVAAQAEHVQLPDYTGRAVAAGLRIDAAQAWEAGTLRRDLAFPHLASGEPLRQSWIATQLARLDAQGMARAQERLEPAPDLTGTRLTRWQDAKRTALEQEERADALERRMLLALRAFGQAHPELTEAELAPLRADFDARRAELEALGTDDPVALAGLMQLELDRVALDDLLDRALRSGTVAGQPLDVSDDLAALQGPFPYDAALRLLRVRSLVDVDAALSAWIQAELDQVSAREPLPAGQAALREDLVRILGLQHDLVPDGEHPTLALWHAWVDARVAEQQDALDRTLASAVQPELAALEQEQSEREQAQAEIEAAAAQQDAQVRQRVQAVVQNYDHDYEMASRRKAELETAEGVWAADMEDLSGRLADLQTASTQIPPAGIGSEREDAVAAIYSPLRTLIRDLRQEALSAGVDRSTASEWASELERQAAAGRTLVDDDAEWARGLGDAEVKLRMLETLSHHTDVLDALELLAAKREQGARGHQTDVVEVLRQAKELRRELRPLAGVADLNQDRAQVIEDLALEVKLVVPSLVTLGVERWHDLRGLPQRLLDLSFWSGLLGAAVKVLIGLGVWRWLRGRLDALVSAAIKRIPSGGRRLDTRAWRELEAPLAEAARAGLDVGVVFLLLGPARELLPELALGLLVWAQLLAYRFILKAYPLLVARRSSARPAAFRLSDQAWTLGLRTVRVVAMWAIARQFLGYVLLTLLQADTLHEVVRTLVDLSLVGVSVVLLHAWEPVLRTRVARQGGDDPIRRYLASEPSQPRLSRWFRALADVVLLSAGALWRLLQSSASERSALGRALNAFYRYALGESEEESAAQGQALPEVLAQALVAPGAGAQVDRPALDQAFWAAFRRWEAEGRQGTLALVGDRGSGRRVWLDQLAGDLADKGRVVRRARLDKRLLDEEALCHWLSMQAGVDRCATVDALQAALESRPPTVFVLEGLHLAFLRRVGGFQAMRALLELLGHAGDRHFWVLVFHLPAWAYLSRLHRILKVHLIQHVVEVPPLSETQLRDMVVGRTQTAGYRVDFQRLVRGGALAGDVDSEEQRSISAFFRVLGEASNGNAAVAQRLWSECLHLQGPTLVEVRLGQALQETRIDGLAEAELFTLAALRMHDGLTEDELASVNNMGGAAVRSSVQVLRGRGLIARTNGAFEIVPRHQASVTRTLWSRNFLDWRQ
jgi:hypothetical protein